MRSAQVLDRGLKLSAGQMLEPEVHIVMSQLHGDTNRFEIAEVDRACNQNLVGNQRHLTP